ncbi:acyl-CoA dehydrogenase family protein [Pseudofrankia inefficax]|uniref:Acyl-CoA dehydrogenase domain-containing protein n=1 Tax=Pseudofrankia inefficax (strain DSM 45817 / CECT 9037 / DDB 130130 / EuI1c) TaxID=298654 RepID=E3IXV5_PSEI1|nr:acyl-CoA dehydrogenase family protein [Pseudofrankia inefficax]ADP81410.1 acyl-CoA dehydrogenase domain-containing protein [Pseudofrankia inefficax]
MDLSPSADQSALRDSLVQLLEKESTTTSVRASEPLGFDGNLWRKVTQLGIPTIGVPEGQGGGGGGQLDVAIAAECFGAHLAAVPVVEAAVVNDLLMTLDATDPSAAALAAEVVAGDLLGTVALHPAAGGLARLVPAGAVANLVIALDGDRLVARRRSDLGPDRPGQPIPNLGSLPLGHCDLRADEVTVLADGELAVALHRRAVCRWKALTAAALVGLGRRALEIGIDYVQQRRAFGITIASFQTIQHRLADNATALDGARLLAFEASWAADSNRPDAERLATMAFLFASETAFRTASESLHFHGGYGYTLEYDIQLYFRRAKAWPAQAGDPRAQYADLARQLTERDGF